MKNIVVIKITAFQIFVKKDTVFCIFKPPLIMYNSVFYLRFSSSEFMRNNLFIVFLYSLSILSYLLVRLTAGAVWTGFNICSSSSSS